MSGKRLLAVGIGVSVLAVVPFAHSSGSTKQAGEVTGSYVLTATGLEATIKNNTSNLTFYYNAGKFPDGRPASATFNAATCNSTIPSGWTFDCGPYEFGPGATAKIVVTASGLSALRVAAADHPDLQLEFSADKATYQYQASIPFQGSTAPPPPPPPSPPPPPAEPVPCTCLSLHISMKRSDAYTTAGQIVPAGARVARIGGLMRWTMTCSSGDGGCFGGFKVLPPEKSDAKIKVYAPVKFVPTKGTFKGKTLYKPGKPYNGLAFTCKGPCTTTNSFPFFLTADSAKELHPAQRAGKTFALRFVVSCGGKKHTQELKFVFKANGDLDKKKSDLD